MNVLTTILSLCDYEETETCTFYILEPTSSAFRTAAGRWGDSDNHVRQARQAGKVRRKFSAHFQNRPLASEDCKRLKIEFSSQRRETEEEKQGHKQLILL